MDIFKSRPNYKIIKIVGQGSFGTVFKILDSNDGKYYAIKRIILNEDNEENIKEAENETKIMREIKSENVVKYIDCFKEEDSINIIMEFCEYNDLKTYIKNYKKKNQLIPESIIRTIITELSSGIKEIHSQNVIHRDLKPEKSGYLVIGMYLI